MSDSKTPEILDDISERDKELIGRHNQTKSHYAPGSRDAQIWGEVTPVQIEIAEEIAETIISGNILPPPISSGDVPVLVSLSSNIGLKETILAEKLGESYKLIAGDIQEERLPGAPNPVILDASFLPFKPNSLAGMVDFQGAIWYEAFHDLTTGYNGKTNANNLIDIFARLRTSLREGGVIITDDSEFFPHSAFGTGVKIDSALKQAGKEIEGFQVSTIGERDCRLRVFKKVT